MKKGILGFYAVCFLAFMAFPVSGAVYSLRPGSGNGGIGGHFFSEMRQLWSETVEMNGFSTRMSVSVCEGTVSAVLEDYYRVDSALRARVSTGDGSAVAVLPLKDGGVTRVLLVQMEGMVVQFLTRLPEHLPQALWPSDVPEVSGARTLTTTRFPERGTVSVQFESLGSVDANVRQAAQGFAGSGWHEMDVSVNSDGSRGGASMLAPDGARWLMLGMGASERGERTLGTVAVTNLRKH